MIEQTWNRRWLGVQASPGMKIRCFQPNLILRRTTGI
jgi:hypothetical protein